MERLGYILRKAVFSLITLFVVLTFNFFLFRIVPGDPVIMMSNPRMRPEAREKLREQFGLDKPIWFNIDAVKESGKPLQVFDSQYFHYFKSLSQGELGISFQLKQPVSEIIAERLGPTVLLILVGEISGIILGTLVGILSAWKARSKIDTLSLIIGLAAWSLPPFWLGIVLLTAARGFLPSGGYITLGASFANTWERWLDISQHLALPAFTLALLLFGSYLLVMRNSMLEVLAEDYILTAKAKGFRQIGVLWRHAVKNASLPLVTIIALDLGYALGGAIQIETIFSWPGLGRLMFDSITQRDYPVLQGVFLLLAVSVITANFLADLTYNALDPRVDV